MNTPNLADLDKVLEKINEIAKESATGDYIYRGEPEHYAKVSSSLYRECPEVEEMPFDIIRVQENVLEEAKAYISKTDDIGETDDIEILTELQHFGGKTNLIDFTEDYLIALFFACDGSHEEDGRVILLRRESETHEVRKPRRKINRVESQKSVFVESPDGFVTPDIEVTIPADLKFPMLEYLRKHHRISIEIIYNDLHGFIRRSAHTEFLKGLTYQRRASEAETRKEKHDHCENAIKHHTEALKLRSDDAVVHNCRGEAYSEKGEYDHAIGDYTKAIALAPDHANSYNSRGIAYGKKGDFDAAIEDFNTAIDLNPEEANAYNNRGIAYVDNSDFDKAIQDYNTAIDLNPESADAYSNRGVAYADNGDFNKAIQDHNTAIDLNPEDVEAYVNRGSAYADNGDFDKAIQDYNTAIDLNPESADAYYNRGFTYLMENELVAAIQDFNTVIDLNPESDDAYVARFIAWLPLIDGQKAEADLTAAKDMGIDIAALFHKGYESVEDFEAESRLKVPEGIAALLRGE